MNNKAFSLIELLVSLIIISLLIGAFAPVITKKLKATDTAVGSFGGKNEGDSYLVETEREVTKDDCDKFDAMYVSKEMNDGKKPVCVTKWNMGDNGLPLVGVQVLSVGQTCTDSGNCCWKGQTANSSKCTSGKNGNSKYSGCTRTSCQWKAANNACRYYAPDGTTVGSWRLPTKEELLGWMNNLDTLNKYKGEDGLQLCDYESSAYGMDQCRERGNSCYGTDDADVCRAHYVLTSNAGTSANSHYAMCINYGAMCANGNYTAFPDLGATTARCVLDSMIKKAPKEEPNNEIRWREPRSYRDCAPFNAMFVPKEYNGEGGKNLCVTQWNAMDRNGPMLTQSALFNLTAVVVSANTNCSDNACCWGGITSVSDDVVGNNTNSQYGTSIYSPRYRTVCTYKSAQNLCHYWVPFGTRQGSWRLPNVAEATGWAQIINTETKENPKLSKWMGAGGLQFCDRQKSNLGHDYCNDAAACTGGTGNTCLASYIWLNGAYPLAIVNGKAVVSNIHNERFGMSVRCVTDEVMDFD